MSFPAARIALALAWLPLLAAPAGPAFAWGVEGHRMIADIAGRYLGAEARREVGALLRHDRLADGTPSQRRTLGEIASWADEIKDTPRGRKLAAWHFDDVPVCGAADYVRHCRKDRCASAQLARNLEILEDAGATLHRRNEALKWVVHLAGDIHQPLHAADHRDRGGNTVQVSFFGERDNPPYGSLNLHAIWDVHMVQRLVAGRGGEGAIVSAPIGEADRRAWEKGSIADWIDESNGIARTLVYPALPAAFACSRRIEGVLKIDAAYYSRMAPVIERQIEKAGVRLARILNRALGGG